MSNDAQLTEDLWDELKYLSKLPDGDRAIADCASGCPERAAWGEN